MTYSSFGTAAVALLLGCASLPAHAFQIQPNSVKKLPSPTAMGMSPGGEDSKDPTKVWYAGIADAVQNVLTNSPLNEGKKALVTALAGDYDKAAVRAKLDGLIEDKAVLMLSFVK